MLEYFRQVFNLKGHQSIFDDDKNQQVLGPIWNDLMKVHKNAISKARELYLEINRLLNNPYEEEFIFTSDVTVRVIFLFGACDHSELRVSEMFEEAPEVVKQCSSDYKLSKHHS